MVPFTLVIEEQGPINHRNVMMAAWSRLASVCGEAIVDEDERERVLETFLDTGHYVIIIDYGPMKHFYRNGIPLEPFYCKQMF